MKSLGEMAYLKFNEAIGMATIMPFDRLRPKVKMAWEKTAAYIASLKSNQYKETEHESA